MQIVEVPSHNLRAPSWNANEMDETMRDHLRQSIQRFGLIVPLVVRQISPDCYETIGGAQRLTVLQEIGIETIPCIIVEADDVQAKLLSQVLNRIAGSDNLGLRAQLLREVLASIPAEEVISVLPETLQSLATITSLTQETIADNLQSWESYRSVRLQHFTFQIAPSQAEVVAKALDLVLPQARQSEGDNPNDRGTALFLLCKFYLEKGGSND